MSWAGGAAASGPSTSSGASASLCGSVSDTENGPSAVTLNCGPIEGGSAHASFGSLGASAFGASGGAGASANSSFIDMITITGGTGRGTYSFDASLDATFVGDGGSLTFRMGSISETVTRSGGVVSETIASAPRSFIFGVPFQFTGSLDLFAVSLGGTDFAEVDAAHTGKVVLGSFQVFDDGGAPVTGFQLTSQSGTDYNAAPGGGVPEPASWALMILGAGLAGGALRRRRTGPARA